MKEHKMRSGESLRSFRYLVVLSALGLALTGCPPIGVDPTDDGADDKDATNKPVITTVVGNGLAGDNGDGLPGTETALYLVQDVTVSPDGLLYFPDWNNHKLRRLNADGRVETFAGTGELGAANDGYGPDVQFNHPTNLEFDGDGNLLVAAWHNSLVKRIDLTTGYATTICGTGARSFNGDGLQGTATFLDLPSSVVWDPGTGNILISDQANFRIRVLEPSGVVHTLCGDGTAAYYGDGIRAEEARISSPKGQSAPPAGRIALNSQGEVILADTGNHVIRKIDGAGVISLVAGTPGIAGYSGDGGPATAATLDTPSDVAVGPSGEIYVADTMNHVVRVIGVDGVIRTFAGTGERGFAGDGGPADEALLDRPYGLTASSDGTVYVADTHNHRIRRITAALPDDFKPPTDDGDAVEIVPCTGEPGSICTYAGTGQKGRNGDGLDQLQTVMYWPLDIEFATDGRVIVLDWNNHQVRQILDDSTVQTILGSDFVGDGPADLSDLTPEGADPLSVDLNHPTDIQILPDGDILIVAWHNHKVRVIDSVTGRVHVQAGATPGFVDNTIAKDARFNQPRAGVLTPEGDLFLLDQRNQRIRVLYNFASERENAQAATIVGGDANPATPAIEPGFNGDGLSGVDTRLAFQTGGNPEPSGGLAYDPVNRYLYVSDSQNRRIRRVEFLSDDYKDSVVTIIAGAGTAGYSGDGGSAVDAQLNNPQDLEIGPDGNLYFADTNNNVVRRVNLTTGVIDTVVGTGVEGYSGDGGAAVNAQLNRPFGVAFDAAGDLYVSDTFNSRVRKVEMQY